MVSMKIEQLIVKCGKKTINGISWRKQTIDGEEVWVSSKAGKIDV